MIKEALNSELLNNIDSLKELVKYNLGIPSKYLKDDIIPKEELITSDKRIIDEQEKLDYFNSLTDDELIEYYINLLNNKINNHKFEIDKFNNNIIKAKKLLEDVNNWTFNDRIFKRNEDSKGETFQDMKDNIIQQLNWFIEKGNIDNIYNSVNWHQNKIKEIKLKLTEINSGYVQEDPILGSSTDIKILSTLDYVKKRTIEHHIHMIEYFNEQNSQYNKTTNDINSFVEEMINTIK
jgi:hypothetical protein